ncbi:unnamed protein product [Macrosiphum euphorbiae]|uniref:Uncharacterized protein n=1 Tax=Macrosiphum euphorbiae TaxID=13131 RepID=A0AAV0WUC1_9HEMI|nr:unnamed protein product [Macrosiphum euphorbiae]
MIKIEHDTYRRPRRYVLFYLFDSQTKNVVSDIDMVISPITTTTLRPGASHPFIKGSFRVISGPEAKDMCKALMVCQDRYQVASTN